MSWHDCHVHGIGVTQGEHGSGELGFDLDYILEWRPGKGGVSFLLVPATLRFHEVTGLRLALDWATPTASMGPLALSGIARVRRQVSEVRQRYTATIWRLEVSWPSGTIEFEAKGYTQIAWGREVVSTEQVLARGERQAA